MSQDIKIPGWVFLLVAAVYFLAVRVDIMDIDAAQYSEISREMARNGDFLHLFDRGYDYLDKPPFLFWITALSIKLFGATNFAYRLPSILFALLAIYATYRLAKLLYNESTGRISALVLACCQGFFLWTNDVRTDMVLTGCVATSLWCIQECTIRRRWYYVLGGTAAIAGGMMTKGPVALFVPLFAFGADWMLRRKWRQLFSPYHLLDAALIALFLVPVSIGLYQQYDLHPEKWIEGKQGTSGLRFFFWTQSFGRITGESAWDNGADPFFLLSSMGWAFLPWILLFLTGLFRNIIQLFKNRFRVPDGGEWLSTGGFILTYLSLCISHYQLPHYILVAFPLAAIVTGKLIYDLVCNDNLPKLRRIFTPVQIGVSGLLLLAGIPAILAFVFPAGVFTWMLWGLSAVLWLLIVLRKGLRAKLLWVSAMSMIAVNVFLTNNFYYPMLGYQCGSQVGRYLQQHHIPQQRVWTWRVKDNLAAIHYYAGYVVRNWEDFPAPGKAGDYLLTMRAQLPYFDSVGRPYSVIQQGRIFKVSEVTPEFLNHKTRNNDSVTGVYALIRLR